MGIGTIEPPSFNNAEEEEDSEDDFGANRKAIKQGLLSGEASKQETEKSEEEDSDDADMFAVPMNSEAFMAKIVAQ